MKKRILVGTLVSLVLLVLGFAYLHFSAVNPVREFLSVFYDVPSQDRYTSYQTILKNEYDASPTESELISHSSKFTALLPIENFFTEEAYQRFLSSQLLFYMDKNAADSNGSISLGSIELEAVPSPDKNRHNEYTAIVAYTLTPMDGGAPSVLSHVWSIGTAMEGGDEKITSFHLSGVYSRARTTRGAMSMGGVQLRPLHHGL